MGTQKASGFNVTGGVHIDDRYGPHASLADAKTFVAVSAREKGLTVGILVSGTVVEYWWKDDTADDDLVIKQLDLEWANILNKPSVFTPDTHTHADKADKIIGAVVNNLVSQDGSGNIQDSGIAVSTDNALSANSDVKVVSERAIKTFVETKDARFYQSFTTNTDENFTIDFLGTIWTSNQLLNGLTADRTITLSNAVNGSQFFLVVRVASGEQNHELLFSGGGAYDYHADWVNTTDDGIIITGSASSASLYFVYGIYDSTNWIIWATEIKA